MHGGERYRLRAGRGEHRLELLSSERAGPGLEGRLRARIDGEEVEAIYRVTGPGLVLVRSADCAGWVRLARTGRVAYLSSGGSHLEVEHLPWPRPGPGSGTLSPEVTPPMPAVVVKVLVGVGDRVDRGQACVVVSAMKMESVLVAPRAGRVSAVRAREGDRVSPGEVLVTIDGLEEQEGVNGGG